MMVDRNIDGTAIAKIMRGLNVSRAQFAELLGVSVQAVYQMERAKRFRPLTAAGVSLMLEFIRREQLEDTDGKIDMDKRKGR